MSSAPWCPPFHPGFVTGLQAEARLAAPLGAVAAGGGLPAGAGREAERLVAEGATALISFGLCGGLDPVLQSGDLIVPRHVIGLGGRYATDVGLSVALGGCSAETLLAGQVPSAEPADKRAKFAATGASGIDLESEAVARVAARHGLAFAVLRAVCDTAEMALPPAALLALDGRGVVSVWNVAYAVLCGPRQLPDLIALGRAAAAARRALVRRVGDIRRGRFLVP